jgi:hypothetical protein
MLGVISAIAWVAASLQGQMAGGQTNAAQSAARAAQAGEVQAAAPQVAEMPSAPAPAPPPQVSPGGRRDPFRPLVIQGGNDAAPVCTSPGKGQLVVAQVVLQGIVRGLDGQWMAVVDNSTNRAYFLYAGDTLCNGVVARITADSLVIEERVTDQAGRTRTREVVKQLAPS